MIIYDSKDKELNIPIGLGNLNRVSPDYSGGNCKGFYEEGYDDGFEEGKTEGIEEGYETGFREGKVEGLDEGYDRGYGEGYDEGKTEGVDVYVNTLPTLTIDRNGVYDTVNKGVTVNVDIPVVDLTGVKFQNSTFNEIPQWIDFENITDMSYMFSECRNLTHVPHLNTPLAENTMAMFNGCNALQKVELFDTSNVTNMSSMFLDCLELVDVPLFDTSKVENMNYMFENCDILPSVPAFDTSNVTTMANMFEECRNITTIPAFDTSKVTYMGYMFNNTYGLVSLPAFDCSSLLYGTGNGNANFFGGSGSIGYYNDLTDLGGFIGLKTRTFLHRLPNLTYQSCINVLNGLYNFVENNEVPNSWQGQLKVHPNFLTTVGEDISIGTNKGWVITA